MAARLVPTLRLGPIRLTWNRVISRPEQQVSSYSRLGTRVSLYGLDYSINAHPARSLIYLWHPFMDTCIRASRNTNPRMEIDPHHGDVPILMSPGASENLVDLIDALVVRNEERSADAGIEASG